MITWSWTSQHGRGPRDSPLSFRNEGQMGDYRDAMAQGAPRARRPIRSTSRRRATSSTASASTWSNPSPTSGETGLFASLGWANGTNSTGPTRRSDRDASMGLQVSGSNWGQTGRPVRRGLRFERHKSSHQHYLAEGGIGIVVGDGALNYGLEQVIEAYYRIQIGRYAQLSPDFQHIWNPGYNRDRGPVRSMA